MPTTARYIGPTHLGLDVGQTYNYQTQNMTGKIFKNPSDPEDKGERDTRIMCWVPNGYSSTAFYKVFESEEEIKTYFENL